MKLDNIGLQFFGENDPAPTPNPAPAPEPAPEKTFTQAELDKVVGDRLAKAMRGMPSKDELSAYRAWKESQQTEKERLDALTKERDESKTALSDALAKVEQFEREKFLLGKGIPAADVDYYAFKIGKLVTDTLTFEKAAEQFLAEQKPQGTMRVDFGAPLGGGQPAMNPNEQMNSLIRGFRK